jgi:hypothetical protein
MTRYANYDTKSPYNYKAARWVERQTQYRFPLDDRPIKDLVGQERAMAQAGEKAVAGQPAAPAQPKPEDDIVFIGDDATQDGEKEDEQDLIYIGDDQ